MVDCRLLKTPRQKSILVRRRFTITFLLLLAIAMWIASKDVWYSPEMRARVVAPDGSPVAGAIVLASWNVEESFSGASLRQASIAEVVTDLDGWFQIRAWGPLLITSGSIRIDEPTVRIYKPGFVPRVLKNYENVPMSSAGLVIRFRFQDQTITLQRFEGSLVEYEATVSPLVSSLSIIYDGAGAEFCYWRKTPRLLLALQDLKLKLAVQGAGNSLRLAHHYASIAPNVQCGNAQQYFGDYVREQTH